MNDLPPEPDRERDLNDLRAVAWLVQRGLYRMAVSDRRVAKGRDRVVTITVSVDAADFAAAGMGVRAQLERRKQSQ